MKEQKNNILKLNKGKDKPVKEKKTSGKRFSMRSIITGSFLEREGLLKQLPFILYISLLFVIYIANSYYGERTIYQIELNKAELVELRSEYITAKSRLMTGTNLSKVSEKLKPLGIYPSHTPPGKIFVKKTDNE